MDAYCSPSASATDGAGIGRRKSNAHSDKQSSSLRRGIELGPWNTRAMPRRLLGRLGFNAELVDQSAVDGNPLFLEIP